MNAFTALALAIAQVPTSPAADQVCDLGRIVLDDLMGHHGKIRGQWVSGSLIRHSNEAHKTIFDRCPNLDLYLPKNWEFEDEATVGDKSNAWWINPPIIDSDGEHAIIYFGVKNDSDAEYLQYRRHGEKWKEDGWGFKEIIT